ncbi:hypothetical protein J4573_49460 [Actinomadura barringtoniae]|uniref:Uncharacterized protein n=1 Tax=Actinomadura barringtoniae TaxID=1427535 RepID=A0A939PMQ6_9ACTN|nr:hypothetical protein [Actinomadura barringtoniae]MBO2455192.1 hypothetical protein [Actinomadura barringtoniae]
MTTMTLEQQTRPAPLNEAYFTRAARDLGDHHLGAGHACACCARAWPCPKALAAAFILDMHDSGTTV